MKLKTAIIDDELHCIETLAYDLETHHSNQIDLVFTARNGLEALKLINKHKPQLIFLDIKMTDLGGFDILEVIDKEDSKVVFTTAHSKYAIRAVGSKADLLTGKRMNWAIMGLRTVSTSMIYRLPS